MKRLQNYIIAAAALALGLASCVPSGTEIKKPVGDGETAYVAIRIAKQKNTRASGEQGGESDIKSVYIATFDDNGSVVAIPEGGYYIEILPVSPATSVPSTITAKKVGAATTKVMVIANPGTKVKGALNALTQGSTFTVFNEAIAGITASEIELADGTFTMISTPSDAEILATNLVPITTALIDVDPSVVGDGAEEYDTDEDAIEAAEDDPFPVALERLVSKLRFNTVTNPTVLPAGAQFEFTSWTVDAVNSTFFPFAKKNLFNTAHSGTSYKYNFYTEDPNFADVAPYQQNQGLVYTTVNRTLAGQWEPVLLWDSYYDWMNDIDAGDEKDNIAYLVENTMAAAAQRYGNATRVVIKGKYVPEGFTMGQDWFRFGGRSYQTLEALQAAYSSTTNPDQPLKDACNVFLGQVKIANPAITTSDFTELTQAQLDAIAKNGGEVAKVPQDGVGIRWFQDSVNYWYYEIRHDQAINGTMAFAKYGAVRNNWYNLTLTEVGSYGTPWYPDLINPGEGDPKPEDPIDSKYGYIGIEITPANWILWESPMKI